MQETSKQLTYVRKRDRLAFQFIVIMVIFGVSILSTLFLYTTFLFRSSQVDADTEPRYLADELAREVQTVFTNVESHLQLITNHFDDDFSTPPLVSDMFDDHLPVTHLRVYDRSGTVRWSKTFDKVTVAPSSPLEITQESFFLNSIRGNPYVGLPFKTEDGVPLMEWSFPIVEEGNEFQARGVLHAYVDLRPIKDIIARNPGLSARIIDGKGIVLLSSDNEKDNSFIGREADQAFLRRDAEVLNYTGQNNEQVLGTWALLQPMTWALVVEVPVSQVFNDVYFSLLVLLVLLVIVVTMLFYTSYFFNRVVLRPVNVLREGIERFAQGDLKYRIKQPSRNEIGVLANTFNSMTERIADEPVRLKKEVANRTEELEVANTQLQLLIKEVQQNSQKVLGKDKALLDANEQLKELNEEMDRVGKILIRRDRDLTSANKRLEELDKVKSEFVSVAAHQLRTPLTAIRWSLLSLSQEEFGSLSSEQKNAVSNGLTSAESAITLINDLLDTARIESGRFGYEFNVGSIGAIVEKAAKHMEQRAKHKGITLEVQDIPDNLCIRHDPSRIVMSIENAIDNAIKYTAPPGEVSVTHVIRKNTIIIRVRDTGIGIPKDQQHRLFTKFFRAPNAMLMQTNGTGLGLYLMKNIVEKHNGTVAIESEEGKGTTIIFTLPLVPCEVEPDNKKESPSKDVSKAKTESEKADDEFEKGLL